MWISSRMACSICWHGLVGLDARSACVELGVNSDTCLTRIWMPSAITALSISLRTFSPQSKRPACCPGTARRPCPGSCRASGHRHIGQRLRVGQQHVQGLREPLNALSNSARTSSGSSTATKVSRSFLVSPARKSAWRRRAGLQARQLVALGVHGALDVAGCEDGQRLLQRLGTPQ